MTNQTQDIRPLEFSLGDTKKRDLRNPIDRAHFFLTGKSAPVEVMDKGTTQVEHRPICPGKYFELKKGPGRRLMKFYDGADMYPEKCILRLLQPSLLDGVKLPASFHGEPPRGWGGYTALKKGVIYDLHDPRFFSYGLDPLRKRLQKACENPVMKPWTRPQDLEHARRDSKEGVIYLPTGIVGYYDLSYTDDSLVYGRRSRKSSRVLFFNKK